MSAGLIVSIVLLIISVLIFLAVISPYIYILFLILKDSIEDLIFKIKQWIKEREK